MKVQSEFCHEKIFHSVRFMIKLQYSLFDILLYDSMLHYAWIKKIIHEHLSGFTGLCIPHWILLISVNWSINRLFVEFWPKYDVAVL